MLSEVEAPPPGWAEVAHIALATPRRDYASKICAASYLRLWPHERVSLAFVCERLCAPGAAIIRAYTIMTIMTECPDFIFLIFVRRLFGAVPKVVVRCPEVVALFVLFLIC